MAKRRTQNRALPKTLSIQDVAMLLGVNPGRVRTMFYFGAIPGGTLVGKGGITFDRDQVLGWLFNNFEQHQVKETTKCRVTNSQTGNSQKKFKQG